MKDSVTIVTGGGTGLGAAVARRIAARGGKVAVNYSKSETEAEMVARECIAAGGEAIAVQADVSQDADCQRLVAATVERFGRLDTLVNNAGISKLAGMADLDALDAKDFFDIYAVNVVGTYQMIRAAVPHMKRAGHGSIVNVSSIAGVIGIGSSTAYAASKGALNTMTLALARSLAPEVQVNAVCPGLITTPWVERVWGVEGAKALEAQVAQMTPLKKASTPDDIAQAVVWFADAPMVTGQLLVVDGGFAMGGPR